MERVGKQWIKKWRRLPGSEEWEPIKGWRDNGHFPEGEEVLETSIQSGHHKRAECQLMAWHSAADDRDVICGKNRLDGDYSLEVVHRSRNGNFETCCPPPQCG